MSISVDKIGKQIKKFRELRNYTQEMIAQKLDMSTPGYGRIERDETELTLQKLQQIATVLETTIQDILGFEDKFAFNNQQNGGYSVIGNVKEINNLQEFQKIYNMHIESMQKEIDWLREMLKTKNE